jgi:hypothetical protein
MFDIPVISIAPADEPLRHKLGTVRPHKWLSDRGAPKEP